MKSAILDHNGKPFEKKSAEFLSSRMSDYVASLGVSRMPAQYRASIPFESHAWVFAAAMTSAVVASQAPFVVYRETEETVRLRTKNNPLSLRAGANRRAIQRHLQQSLAKRLSKKGIEPDYESPIYNRLLQPNP